MEVGFLLKELFWLGGWQHTGYCCYYLPKY
jgi:hypothetical protein